jgi:hypothetical protein
MVDRVTRGEGRLCIDCRYCSDNGKPTSPGLLVCTNPKLAGYIGSMSYCSNVRWFEQGFLRDVMCGQEGRWFEDALGEDPA